LALELLGYEVYGWHNSSRHGYIQYGRKIIIRKKVSPFRLFF
jgi:hypothetical protein